MYYFVLEWSYKNIIITGKQGTQNQTSAPINPSEPSKITVQVSPKNITFPENTATLTAFPIPDAPKEYPYSYEWILINEEDKEGAEATKKVGVLASKNEQQLKLSGLEEGTYQFKVTVMGTQPAPAGSKGEAIGVVTVFPGVL